MPSPVRLRLIHAVKQVAEVTFWGDRQCPKSPEHFHCRARVAIAEYGPDVNAHGMHDWGKEFDAHRGDKPPCDACGQPVDRISSGGVRTVFSSPSGKPEVGDCYLLRHGVELTKECTTWDNCPGQHFHVVLPDGVDWDVDSVANNCTLPGDRMHRCWSRQGTPPLVTAGKVGPTCAAGAGSIKTSRYHGFLNNGVLEPTGDSQT